jgi:predicted transcriptional regulator
METAQEYEVRYQRLVTQANGRPEALNQVAARTSNTRTYFCNRAAIAYVCWQRLQLAQRLLSSETGIEAAKVAAARDAEWHLEALKAIQPGCPIVLGKREKRRSKRQSLRRLPDNWRTTLPKRLTAHHRDGYWVTALTGCRPCELKKGVKLERRGNVLQVTIEGAKVTADGGHKIRRQEWDLDASNKLLRAVLTLMAGASAMTVTCLDGFSRAIKDAGKRIWPKRPSLSAYSLRHAISSDLKAMGWTPEEIALFLGHAVTKTQSMYGAAGQGGGGAVGLRTVSGSRPVKDNRRPPPAARRKGPRML